MDKLRKIATKMLILLFLASQTPTSTQAANVHKALKSASIYACIAGFTTASYHITNLYRASKDASDIEDVYAAEKASKILHKYGAPYMKPADIEQIRFKECDGRDNFAARARKYNSTMYIDSLTVRDNKDKAKFALLHELGHIYHRDSDHIFLSQIYTYLGLRCADDILRIKLDWRAKIFGMLGLSFLSQHLYSCKAEARADQFAIDCLKAKNDTNGLIGGAKFFEKRIQDDALFESEHSLIAKTINLIDTHPDRKSRADRCRKAEKEIDAKLRPAPTREEFAALIRKHTRPCNKTDIDFGFRIDCRAEELKENPKRSIA
jgi:Zn-dependent protease with chaperone function